MSQDYSGLQQVELGEVTNARRPAQEVPDIEVNDREIPNLLSLDLEKLDPNYTYRWVRKHPLRISRAKAKGYAIVDPSEEDVQNIIGDEVGERADGTITVGDVLLMRCPKKDVTRRRAAIRSQNEKRLGSVKKQFKKMARKAGAEVITTKEE